MEPNLITVIVPVYKVEAYLDRCVQSIADQTYKDLEIILVDDGSPDNCPTMCDTWAKKDNRIRVIHKANGGLSDARNAGMSLAKGEYIAFIDSDDWIAPEMLERLVEAMERDESDIAACAVEMVWDNEKKREALTVRKNCVLEQHEAQRALLRESLLKQPVWYKLYRRGIIQNVPFEVGKYHEDVFWSYQAIGNARRVCLIDYVGYYYWQRSDSIMGEKYSLKRLDGLEAAERRHAYFVRYFPELEQESKLSIIGACIFHGQMAFRNLNAEERKAAFAYLESVKKRYPLERSDLRREKTTRALWLFLAGVSLRFVCRLRNTLGVGL